MHLDGWRKHPERICLAAACDPDGRQAQRRAEAYGIPHVFADLDAMLEGAEWDVAVVCTPTSLRMPVIRALADAGKHLLVEKPLADSYDEAARIVEVCRQAGVQLAVDQNVRYHYSFEIARELIEEGRLGQVVGVAHQDLMFRQDSGWRLQRPRHALAVMGIHWLDGFRRMLDREALSVTCRTAKSSAIHCMGETDAYVQIAFEGGATVDYVQSFSSPLARAETLVFGEAGVLRLDYGGAALYSVPARDASRTPSHETWSNPYAGGNKPESAYRCLDELLTAIEENRMPSNSGEDNLKTIALLEGAYRSAELAQPIGLQRAGTFE